MLDQGGSRRADVRISQGKVVEVAESLVAGDDEQVLDAVGCVVHRASSTSTPTCGNRARRRPRRSRPDPAGGAGRIHLRRRHANTDPTQDTVSVVEFVRRQGESAGLCDVRRRVRSRSDGWASSSRPMAELADVGVRIFH